MKDKIGIWTSIICLIHCLVFPLMATIFPLFIDLDIKVEILLISVALIIGTISFLDNALKHKYWLSLGLFLAGFLGLISGTILESETIHIMGLLILILAHYKNYKKIKQSDGCHPHGCKH